MLDGAKKCTRRPIDLLIVVERARATLTRSRAQMALIRRILIARIKACCKVARDVDRCTDIETHTNARGKTKPLTRALVRSLARSLVCHVVVAVHSSSAVVADSPSRECSNNSNNGRCTHCRSEIIKPYYTTDSAPCFLCASRPFVTRARAHGAG